MSTNPTIEEAINNELSENVKRVTNGKFKSVNQIDQHLKMRREVMASTMIISIMSLLGVFYTNIWYLFLLVSVISVSVSLAVMKFSRSKQSCVELLNGDAKLSDDTINEFNRVFNTLGNPPIPYNSLTVLEFYRLVLIYNSYIKTLCKIDDFKLNMIGGK